VPLQFSDVVASAVETSILKFASTLDHWMAPSLQATKYYCYAFLDINCHCDQYLASILNVTALCDFDAI